MRLLIVAATAGEVQPLLARFTHPHTVSARHTRFQHSKHQIDVLITGVGMVATAAWCAQTLARQAFDAALNIGVCGSFRDAIPPGTVVHVVTECLPELGAEDGEQFVTLQDLGLLDKDDPPFHAGRLLNNQPPVAPTLTSLPHVHGITVNTVHGHDPSIARVAERWSPDVESMEGAAFMYACLAAGISFAQVRAVSNRVERRNRENWKLLEAIERLTDATGRIIDEL